MIFLTVGTQFPFDRLVKSVDQAFDGKLINEEIFAQIGETSYKPLNFESVVSLEKNVFDKRLREASSVISHAGMGTITMALKNHKPLLVMPRLKRYREHVNDHQVDTARKFEELGHILAVYEVGELSAKIEQLKDFVPRKREAQPQAVAERIARFLNDLANNGK